MTDTTTITVSTELRNEQEIVLHAQFLAALLQGRANNSAGFVQPAPVANTPPAPPRHDPSNTVSAFNPPAPAKPATVVADISPDGVERKFRDFVHRHGTPVARKLLDKYNAPFLRDVPADKLGEFVEEISR